MTSGNWKPSEGIFDRTLQRFVLQKRLKCSYAATLLSVTDLIAILGLYYMAHLPVFGECWPVVVDNTNIGSIT